MSPAVAALLQEHASDRRRQDDAEPATPLLEGSVAEESSALEDAAAVAGEGDTEAALCPEPLPAGLTALMLKGCAATEAGKRFLQARSCIV